MNYKKLNDNWNAEPNAPEVFATIKNDKLVIEFGLNYFLYDQFREGDKGRLTFIDCSRYHLGITNDEGYYLGQYRIGDDDLPWSEFYQIQSGLNREFPTSTIVNENITGDLNHYIFFFRDNTLEVEARDYLYEIIKN